MFTAAGGGAVALLNAGTFVVAAATLLFLRVQESKPEPGSDEGWWPSATAGFRHIRRTPVLGQVVLAAAVALLVVGFVEALPEETPVRRGLPPAHRRRQSPAGSGSGRPPGGDYRVERGQPNPDS